MKKALENELMSLAHRILQHGGRTDVELLKESAKELYEKLAVLAFAEKHFDGPKPTIGKRDIEAAMEEKNELAEKPIDDNKIEQPDAKNPPTIKEPEPITEQMPSETVEKREDNREAKPSSPADHTTSEAKENDTPGSGPDDFEDIAVSYDDLPQFEPVKPKSDSSPSTEDERAEPRDKAAEKDLQQTPDSGKRQADVFATSQKNKTKNELNPIKKSLNDRLNKGLVFGLNDRVAFINHLFDGNATDFNRVISQLNTIHRVSDAKIFIEHHVKPDYDWKGKEEYEERFVMAIEEKLE